MLEMGKRISAEVLALPYVQSIEQQVGRAELGEDTWGPHRSEFHVELKADAKVDQHEAQEQLRKILADYPGPAERSGDFPRRSHQRELERRDGTGGRQSFRRRFGRARCDRRQDRARCSARFPASSICNSSARAERRRSASNFSPQAMAAAGLKAQDVLDTINTAYAGAVVGQTFRATRTVDVVLLLPDELRHQPAQLARLMIASPTGPGAAVAGRPHLAHPGSIQHRTRRRPTAHQRDLQCRQRLAAARRAASAAGHCALGRVAARAYSSNSPARPRPRRKPASS